MTELISSDPDVMGGMPCFAGTRVPIAFVLASLDEGESFARLKAAYPFLTQDHVAAAREFAATHEVERPPKLEGACPSGRLITRRVVRAKGGAS